MRQLNAHVGQPQVERSSVRDGGIFITCATRAPAYRNVILCVCVRVRIGRECTYPCLRASALVIDRHKCPYATRRIWENHELEKAKNSGESQVRENHEFGRVTNSGESRIRESHEFGRDVKSGDEFGEPRIEESHKLGKMSAIPHRDDCDALASVPAEHTDTKGSSRQADQSRQKEAGGGGGERQQHVLLRD
eukprot:6205299-Pleurochrysis_carterae.AAC.1